MERLLTKSLVACALVAAGVAGLQACGGRDQLIAFDGEGGGLLDDDGSGAGPVDDDGAGGFGAGPDTGGFGGFGGDPNTGGFGGFGAGPSTGGFGGAPSTSVVSSSAVTTNVSSSSGVGGAPATTSVGVGGMGGNPSTSVVSSSATTVGVGGMGGDPSTTSVGVGGAPATTSVGVGGMGGTGGSGGMGGSGGGNPLDCINCIGNNCPQAVQCVTDPVCVQGTICAVQNCLTGGQPDLICVLNCFNGDLGTALLALQSVGCIFNQCGNECTGIFGGGP